MNIFDIVGLASKVPYDLIQKLQADAPKIERLVALSQEAQPYVAKLMPIAQEAEGIWASISPDVATLLKVIGTKS